MMNRMRKFFDAGPAHEETPGGDASGHDTRIAVCALFLEMGKIDGEFSEEEQASIASILEREYQLSRADVAELMNLAMEKLDESIDLWHFANRINKSYSEEEKLWIIEMIWRIVYVDGTLDQHEDYLIRKLSTLLHISHKQFINAKMKVLHDPGPMDY